MSIMDVPLEYIAKCARVATTLVGGLASSGGEAAKKLIKNEKIDPSMLVIALISGALQGYKVGSDIPDIYIKNKLMALANNSQDMW